MNLKWVLLDNLAKEAIDNYAQKLNVPPIIAKILLNRGIDTFDKAKLFFRGKMENLYDPFYSEIWKKQLSELQEQSDKRKKY